jgi:predicted nuclease of restriction endonuclease-like (RecB) superfamily
MVGQSLVSAEYLEWLADLKDSIRHARLKANMAVNSELIQLYWRIGSEILKREADQGWGTRIIDRLSADLSSEFPDRKGFSPRNLRYMRDFASTWKDPGILQQVVAKFPWGHNVRLLDAISQPCGDFRRASPQGSK